MTSLKYVKPEKISLKNNPQLSEKWVQERLAEDPSLLGLGDLILKDKERIQPRAGRLDLLLQDAESEHRYEVEIQLGSTDEAHIIRTIEYWDVERKRLSRHMKLYSYIVTHDTGFAPNPFWRFCTLACCKPAIRRSIGRRFNTKEEFWIVGLSPKSRKKGMAGNNVVFAMRVTQNPMTFREYFLDKRFENKKPNFNKSKKRRVGDNIYEPIWEGRYDQLRSRHSRHFDYDDWKQDKKHKKHDLNGRFVLASKDFYYFGSDSKPLPPSLSELKVARGHKCRFAESTKKRFLKFIRKQVKGRNALPTQWDSVKSSQTVCS